MNHIDKKAGLPTRGIWLGIALLLAGGLGITSLTTGQDAPRLRQEPVVGAQPAAAAAPQMTIRGTDAAVVGRRFTLEVIIANPTAQAVKDLEFVAELDGNLEQDSKARSHAEKIGSIATENVYIVRMAVTPTKKGPARVDIILSSKNGPRQQVQQVIPVFTAEDAPQQAERPVGASPLTVSVTSPKDCFADRPAMFLIHVHNAGAQATKDNMELVVSYGTMNNAGVNLPQNFGGPGFGGRRGTVVANQTNPVREAKINVPTLGPNESRTVPVTLTAHRIGDFRLAIAADSQRLGFAGVNAKFDPNATVHSLLPATFGSLAPRLPKSLADVPEVGLEDRVSKTMKADEAFEHIAHMMDKVNHANAKKVDAFVAALLEKRPDMNGMPMAMGDSCRLTPERANHFISELGQLRNAMAQSPNGNGLVSRFGNPGVGGQFTPDGKQVPVNVEKATSARIGAMMQVLGPENVTMRQELIKYLATVSTTESTQALAKLAIFSEEEQVRQSAIDALKNCKQKDYTDVLVNGLNYPWPAVAQNASDAIVKLKRHDLMPQLVNMLERPDPRAPVTEECCEGKQVVREMVKINHLRNCMLCHPPRSNDQNLPGIAPASFTNDAIEVETLGRFNTPLLAQVPIPNQALPASPGNGGGYGQFSVPDTLIRFDVTYLRQDFSVMLPVTDHQPWPQTQRFDFLVRTREITDQEAKAYRDLLRQASAGDLTPYQRAAVAALRSMTGRDAEPTAPAWRKILEQVKG